MKKVMVQIFILAIMLSPYVVPIIAKASEGGGP